jgi:glycosyltransferase involved in cell wall biosynthesis
MIRINQPKKIAFISSFPPRKCGIATFTSNLIENIGLAGGADFRPLVIAMQPSVGHQYADPVEFVVRRNIRSDYSYACDYMDSQGIDAISLQHEFGLFGGKGGSYVNLLLRQLKVPVVTTLHTVLEKPSLGYFNALTDVCDLSHKIVVMNKRGIKMLTDIYGVPERKIELIPHGIPNLPFDHSDFYKRKLALAGRTVILTFGLLGRNKGIEVMLRAMPAITKARPDILYIILGTTHPEVIKHEGRSYINELHQMVKELRLENHVVFYDQFVSDKQLQEFLCAADIYVTPYLNKEQLTSGTLAFAVGAGKAVVSTPYWAAEELLTQGRGRLVPFGDSKRMASEIVELLDDRSLFYQIRRQAYEYGRPMTWSKVGQSYWDLFERSLSGFMAPLKRVTDSKSPGIEVSVCSRQPAYQSA